MRSAAIEQRATELDALDEEVERMDDEELRELGYEIRREIDEIDEKIEWLEDKRRHKRRLFRLVDEALNGGD